MMLIYLFDNLHTDDRLSSLKRKLSEIFCENVTFIPLGVDVIVVTAIVLLLSLIQLTIAITLSIYPLDNLYIDILLEIFILMLLTLQVDVEVAVKIALVLLLVVTCIYYFFVNWSFPLSILWKFKHSTQTYFWDPPLFPSACA
jgi:hypothetical protein